MWLCHLFTYVLIWILYRDYAMSKLSLSPLWCRVMVKTSFVFHLWLVIEIFGYEMKSGNILWFSLWHFASLDIPSKTFGNFNVQQSFIILNLFLWWKENSTIEMVLSHTYIFNLDSYNYTSVTRSITSTPSDFDREKLCIPTSIQNIK